MTAVSEHVPSPADVPQFTAAELLDEIEARGARIFRMRQPPLVFCLTQNEETMTWILRQGGRPFVPAHMRPEDLSPTRAYKRTKDGPWEWDIYIHAIPVSGEQTIWEAAGSGGRP